MLETFDWRWLISPAVGAVIGYVTNDIAVRMLLRPHEEKRFLGRRVPFTPGLIARERGRLAASIREVLDRELLTPQVLSGALLSQEMLQKLDDAAQETVARLRAEEKSPREMLSSATDEERAAEMERRACAAARDFLMKKLLESGLENQLAQFVMQEISARLDSSMGKLKGLLLDDRRSAQYQAWLAQGIRNAVEARGPQLLEGAITQGAEDVMTRPVGEVFSTLPLEAVGDALKKEYVHLVKTRLPQALEAVNLGSVVEDKLNAISMAELERLIMAVMRKELRAIVWLGALLGCMMGFVQAALNLLL